MEQNKLQQLRKKKEYYVNRIFYLGLEIALIFGVPAGLGAWIGSKLGGGTPLFLILGGTFIFSWVLVILRYRTISKQIREVEDQIAHLEEEEAEE